MKKIGRETEKDMYGKPASVMPLKVNKAFKIPLDSSKKDIEKLEINANNFTKYTNDFEFDEKYMQNIRFLVDPILRNAIKKRDCELIIARIRQLNIIPETVFNDITIEKASESTQSPRSVVTPVVAFTVAAGVASVMVAVTAAVAIGVYSYVRTKGKRFSLGDFGSPKIYPQMKPILRQIETMTDTEFATEVDKKLIDILCIEIKEYIKLHPELDLPDPSKLEGELNWQLPY